MSPDTTSSNSFRLSMSNLAAWAVTLLIVAAVGAGFALAVTA